MSIQPPSDIVLDVAQAADPVKSLAAAQRLTKLSPSDGAGDGFSGVLENLAPLTDNSASLRSRLNVMGGSGSSAATDARTKAYKGLEALIFQNLFETTLPHDTSLGPGMAGDVWRSMMAEQLSKQIANVVDLGLMPKSPASHKIEPGHTLSSGASTETPPPPGDFKMTDSSS